MFKSVINALFVFCVFGIICLVPSVSRAAESSFLTEEINASVKQVEANNQKVKQQTEQDKRVLAQFLDKKRKAESAGDQDVVYKNQQDFYAKLSHMLKGWTEAVVYNEKELENIYTNMQLIAKQQKDSKTFGLGPEISRTDAHARKAITEVLNGYKDMITMVETLDPEADVSAIKAQLTGDYRASYQHFNGMKESPFDAAMEVALNALALTQTVKQNLGLFHDRLLGDIFYVDANHIANVLGTLNANLLGDGLNPGLIDKFIPLTDEMRENRSNGSGAKLSNPKGWNEKWAL